MNKKLAASLLFLILSALLIYKNPGQRFPASGPSREGVFIGSFDPFTKGHMSVVLASIKDLSLDKIHIQVNSLSNKDYSASIGERIELIKKALEHYPLDVEVVIEAEPVEGKRKFVQNLHEKTGADIYQVMGADVLEKSDELFGDLPYVKRFVARRLDDDTLQNIDFKDNKLASSVNFLDVRAKGISSTKVKEMLRNGDIPYAYLEGNVIDTIVNKKLYQFPAQDVSQLKKDFFGKFFVSYMTLLKEEIDGLTLPDFSSAQDVQFTWSQSNEGFLEHLIRVVLKENKELTQEEKSEVWKVSRKIYQDLSIQKLVQDYEVLVGEKSTKAQVFLGTFENISNEFIEEVSQAIENSDEKIIFAIDANYIKASSIPEARERRLLDYIEEKFPLYRDRFEVVIFEQGEKPHIVQNLVDRKFGVKSSVVKIQTKSDERILPMNFNRTMLEEVEKKLVLMEDELRSSYITLNEEGYSLNDLIQKLETIGDESADYVKEWEKRNILYQEKLDRYYTYNFDYQIISSMLELDDILNESAKSMDRFKRAELLKYKERIQGHFTQYFMNKENYGAKKDVLRVDHLQGYFKSLRETYHYIEGEPTLSFAEKIYSMSKRFSKKFNSLIKEVRLLPETSNLLFTYYIQKSKNPQDAVVALNRYFKKKARVEGVNMKMYDDISSFNKKADDVVTIFTPNHVQGDLDGMLMGELQRDNSLLFAARSRMKWRQKLFDQVPNSNLIVVGGESDPVDDVLTKIKLGNSKEVYIYPEGHFAGMTGETRVPKIGFSAGLLRKLKMENIKYEIVPMTFHGSAGIVGDVGNLKGKELAINTGRVLDEKMTSFIDKNIHSRTFYNTFVRANWLEDHALSSDNIHGSPSAKKLKLILGRYKLGDVDSCHDVMKSLLSI
ncbi:hypothetical protein [Bacteriovorax sp. Seq25_V]|uniref:hypothetical protein n=1 Tax=Bacteriovorax sp. Seq25_V TaxID=1201288 RepID=UPI0012F93DD8|nr:hypothetical protein [Bacteriovorax sp. Seq25_V]